MAQQPLSAVPCPKWSLSRICLAMQHLVISLIVGQRTISCNFNCRKGSLELMDGVKHIMEENKIIKTENKFTCS